MKVLSQLLGRYSNHNKPLILFRLPDTDTLLYRLSDIEPLFNLPPFSVKKYSYKNCYRDHEETYLDTNALSDLAQQFNRQLLAELCQFQPNDYNIGLVDSILQTFPRFKRAPKEEHIWESVQLPLEKLEDVIRREEGDKAVKTEPTSPSLINHVIPESRSAMALDTVLLNSNELRRQNVSELERPANKRHKVGATGSSSPSSHTDLSIGSVLDREKRPHSLSAVTNGTATNQPLSRPIRKIHSNATNDEEQQFPSNKKRLSIKHKNSLNLTIFAPSYNEQLTGVRSAPINSNFDNSKPIPSQQQAPLQHHKSHYANQQTHHGSAVGSTSQHMAMARAPASATIARPPFAHQPSPRRHEFAIPPIVPSQQQQQQPHSAHPTSRENVSYQHYIASPSLYGTNGHHSHNGSNSSKPHPPHQTSSSSTYKQKNYENQLAVNAASAPLPPKTPTTNSFAALQRQQYLQPFEHLFDTIETTRTLKSTLDDQIRRSSSLMQTLQTSATTIEGLVRNQVKEAQWEMTSQIERMIDGLIRRTEAIEARLYRGNSHRNQRGDNTNGLKTMKPHQQQQSACLPSPLPSATTREERAAAEDLVAFSEKRRDRHNEELQTPPTIVRSQNDIGPQEYHNMLNTLRDRLDRLERQIDT